MYAGCIEGFGWEGQRKTPRASIISRIFLAGTGMSSQTSACFNFGFSCNRNTGSQVIVQSLAVMCSRLQWIACTVPAGPPFRLPSKHHDRTIQGRSQPTKACPPYPTCRRHASAELHSRSSGTQSGGRGVSHAGDAVTQPWLLNRESSRIIPRFPNRRRPQHRDGLGHIGYWAVQNSHLRGRRFGRKVKHHHWKRTPRMAWGFSRPEGHAQRLNR
jgi:hypothetical protein